ncbi:hypothetical protein ACTFIR_010372 [Dictyostelium discoideum]
MIFTTLTKISNKSSSSSLSSNTTFEINSKSVQINFGNNLKMIASLLNKLGLKESYDLLLPPGGIILVSHGFRLISQVAKEIWGNITSYKNHLKAQMRDLTKQDALASLKKQ